MFYLFWRAVSGNTDSAGGAWALLGGCLIAILQFFLGYFVEPEGFGFSRWLNGCIDIVTLPALAPIIVYVFLVSFKLVSGAADFTSFALLWLIPGAAVRALNWGSLNDPILLVGVPVLWSAIVVGVSFFIGVIQRGRKPLIFPALLAILIIPFAAANSYWAFYSQQTSMGLLFFSVATVPMLISVILSFIKAEG